jgi:RNA polymerase sigma-70 factor (ECF subfamily)
VGSAPTQSAAAVLPIDGALADELWQLSEAGACGLEREAFLALLRQEAAHLNPAEPAPSRSALAEHFHSLRLADLVLARACAQGCERAWERFLTLYRQPLIRAAISITGSESLGRDLADQLYAELYGLVERDGERRCPLLSYRGRGSLLGWLRTTLAQRHVDHHRRTHREQPLDNGEQTFDPPAAEPDPPPAQLAVLRSAIGASLAAASPEDRFLLAAYYLDGRKLHQIAATLGVHEATISRKLKRAAETVHKQVLQRLQTAGLSRRAAEEALGADPRDLEMNVKSWMQADNTQSFQGEAAG